MADMTAEALWGNLKKLQEPKGYFFNSDLHMTMALLESLLINKKRYGYMACPCRLASGDIKLDRDIICPCAYREADVKEYGACFCGLYVSRDWNEKKIPHALVPERRPAQNVI